MRGTTGTQVQIIYSEGLNSDGTVQREGVDPDDEVVPAEVALRIRHERRLRSLGITAIYVLFRFWSETRYANFPFAMWCFEMVAPAVPGEAISLTIGSTTVAHTAVTADGSFAGTFSALVGP